MPKQPLPHGRPKASPDSLPDNWREEALALYEQGASDVEIKAKIHKWRGSFSNDLWDRWMLEEPSFSETIRQGRLVSNAWWESNGRLHLENPKFSYTGWYMNMKNRFSWCDKQEVAHSGELGLKSLSNEELDAKLALLKNESSK